MAKITERFAQEMRIGTMIFNKHSVSSRYFGLFFIYFATSLIVFSNVAFALTKEQKKVYDMGISYFDVADCESLNSEEPAVDSGAENSSGKSLGGYLGMGIKKSDVDKAKKFAKRGLKVKEGDYTGTAYGPPWNSMEGTGITSTGIKLDKPAYVVASDPDNKLPYGSLVKITPNPHNWDGPFLVADTGGAFHDPSNPKVDFYDWKGRDHQNKWGEKKVKVTEYDARDAAGEEDALTGDNTCACAVSGGQSTKLSGDNNVEKAYNFLKGKGLDDTHTAAILGNFMQESTMDPKAVNPSSGATGIAQWLGGRLTGLKNKAGKDYLQLDAQLDWLWYEMENTEKAATKKFLATKTLRDATASWGNDWERAGASEMNHANRYAQAKIIYKKYAGNGSGTDIGDSDACTGAVEANVNAEGYSFPVGLPKKELTNWGSPWCRKSCHHDGTPAMDITQKGFGTKSVGVAVFAISDGTIVNLHTYNGISGCYSFHLKSKDNHDYYYTHLRKPTKENNNKVKAGEKLAEIGETKCTGNGSDPHLHIDRGKKGLIGGITSNRDPGFYPLMNKLYDELD